MLHFARSFCSYAHSLNAAAAFPYLYAVPFPTKTPQPSHHRAMTKSTRRFMSVDDDDKDNSHASVTKYARTTEAPPSPSTTAASTTRTPPTELEEDDDDDSSCNSKASSCNNGDALTPPSLHPWYYLFTKGDAEYNTYMSQEWGYESRGDQALFEMLSLEGAQAGLSWYVILRKREAYRRKFHNFDIRRVAQMTSEDVERILAESSKDPRQIVVRHRGKIQSVIDNAQCILKMYDEHPGETNVFDRFLWSYVNDQPILNNWNGQVKDMPTKSSESEAMSIALKKKGFRFVGPTQIYAFMQSVGMVVDHPVHSLEWRLAYERLQQRPGGYQHRRAMHM
jgi:DNA-3-methyladenine glycosylase I